METKENSLKHSGISSFELKLIALICMIIDHVGYYFVNSISVNMYTACRIIGRISMPIFLFLIVQGYIHTRNFKKYIIRLLFFACITQFALFLCEFIGIEVMQKINTYNICLSFNILFSFVLCLFFLKLLDSVLFEKYFTKDSIKKKVKSDNNIKDKDRNENIKKIKNKKVSKYIKRVIYILLMISIFFVMETLDFDYGDSVIILASVMYILELAIEKGYIRRKGMINLLILVIIFLILIRKDYFFITIFSILPAFILIFYNGKLTNLEINKKFDSTLKYSFYVMFPLQHFALYMISLIIR